MTKTVTAHNSAQVRIREHNDIPNTFVVSVFNADGIIDEQVCDLPSLGTTVVALYQEHKADTIIPAEFF